MTDKYFQALPTRGEQIEHLLSDALPRRPPEDVVLFAKALIDTGQGHHLEEKGVSREHMDFIRGFSKDHTSQVVQGKENISEIDRNVCA